MLPDGCQESRGSLKSIFSTMLDGFAKCALGYEEPDKIRMSRKTGYVFFQKDVYPVSFRDARIVIDDDIPDGIVELINTKFPHNPLCNGRVIFNDFPTPVEFMENI